MLYILSAENKKQVGDVLKTSPNITILYYWDMCGHCAALKPTWEKVCKKYKNARDCDILNVEATHLHLLPVKYKKGVKGYPTIIKYNEGKKEGEYDDERVFKKLEMFVKKVRAKI
jgi:thiol-disulfide isomerase/thioredoxin